MSNMQDWDRLVMIVLGLGAATYTGVVGRRLWRDAQRKAGVGLFLLGLSTVVIPVVLAIWGG